MKLLYTLVALSLILGGCKDDVQDAKPQGPSVLRATGTQGTAGSDADPIRAADECASTPPPFEATYLPPGFSRRLLDGAGLFKGADGYPTEGLLGHHVGPRETQHINFEVRPGPLPYVPTNPKPITVLGNPGSIGAIEGGFSVEFSLGKCAFRMDNYGVDRDDTIASQRASEERLDTPMRKRLGNEEDAPKRSPSSWPTFQRGSSENSSKDQLREVDP